MRTVPCLALLALACVQRAPPVPPDDNANVDVLVVVPHPDDEVLMAGGVIARAVSEGKKVAVVVMTNGDKNVLLCPHRAHDGLVRESETVDALALLGVREDQIIFLGYPDGSLSRLRDDAELRVWRLGIGGQCEFGSETYAVRGAYGLDEHAAHHHGRGASYTQSALLEDLAAIIARTRPADVYLPARDDNHPDHASTHAYVLRAVELAGSSTSAGPPVFHEALVHSRLNCWPISNERARRCPVLGFGDGSPLSPFLQPEGYRLFDERAPVPRDLSSNDAANLKFRALNRHRSQLTVPRHEERLLAFIRADEAFVTSLRPTPLAGREQTRTDQAAMSEPEAAAALEDDAL